MADGYVRPLKPREVRVQDDRFGIHHDSDTVKKVMQSIVEYHETHAATSSRVGVMESSRGGVMAGSGASKKKTTAPNVE